MADLLTAARDRTFGYGRSNSANIDVSDKELLVVITAEGGLVVILTRS